MLSILGYVVAWLLIGALYRYAPADFRRAGYVDGYVARAGDFRRPLGI